VLVNQLVHHFHLNLVFVSLYALELNVVARWYDVYDTWVNLFVKESNVSRRRSETAVRRNGEANQWRTRNKHSRRRFVLSRALLPCRLSQTQHTIIDFRVILKQWRTSVRAVTADMWVGWKTAICRKKVLWNGWQLWRSEISWMWMFFINFL